MRRKHILNLACLTGAALLLSTAAFAIEQSEVESAVAASSKPEVAGNVFIWFLCAIAFLKISQKIDNFMASLGINVGRAGGSMVSELLIAGRALGIAGRSMGGAIGNLFNRNSSSTTNNPAGQAFTGKTHGLVQNIQKKAGNAAAANATGNGAGVSNFIGRAMLNSSIHKGGQFASEVIGAVATGNIATVGSITGDKAADALSCYMGYSPAVEHTAETTVERVNRVEPLTGDCKIITLNGVCIYPTLEPEASAGHTDPRHTMPADRAVEPGSVPAQIPSFRNVEIGGGRITGYETPAGGGAERQFAMYNASQYMEPTGQFEMVETADGESWYKQYAAPTVEKTPYEDKSGKIEYKERIVEQLPQIPKRKDRV